MMLPFPLKHCELFFVLILGCLWPLSQAWSSTTDPCTTEEAGSKKLYCQAIYYLDANRCYKIENFELRQHCTLQVKDAQRHVTYQVSAKKQSG